MKLDEGDKVVSATNIVKEESENIEEDVTEE
jgi:hypothetical protein